MDTTEELLKKYWGYTSFLPLQKEIIDSVLKGQDTLAIMATGGGKSLCYQSACPVPRWPDNCHLPPDSAHERPGRRPECPGNTFSRVQQFPGFDDRKKIEVDLKNNCLRLLFLSPEKCMQMDFLTFLKTSPVCLFAIDEAHCISEWGHNFRPDTASYRH